jgi:hypothetical protein
VAIAVPGPLRAPLAALALAIALATVVGMLWLHRAETLRAVSGMALGWGLIMLIVGAWLVPAAEPDRMSRRVGERLAAIEAGRGLEPVLLEYKEPGVVYAVGHPLTVLRDRPSLDALLDRRGEVLTVLTPGEADVYRRKHGLDIKPIESLEGFSLTKGRGHVLQIATLRRADPRDRSASSFGGLRAAEQTLVK